MPAYSYTLGATYRYTETGKQFTVIDIDEHEFDPDLTQVEIVWEDGDWQGIFADDFGHDIRKVSGPEQPTNEPCECQHPAYGENYIDGEVKYYCLACGGD